MVTTGQLTLNTTPQLVHTAQGRTRLCVRSNNVMNVGDSTVTTSTGYIGGGPAGDVITVDMSDGDEIWAVLPSGTTTMWFIAMN